MANLTLEGREEVRAYVEEKLKEVPEGKRMKLPKETLEKLLFEEVVLNQEKNIKIKFPVWSGDFLRKLDLSEVDFEDVTWDSLKWKSCNIEYEDDDFEITNNLYSREFKKIYNLQRLNNDYIVNYSGTNANIDLSLSFEFKYVSYFAMDNCDCSNCEEVYFSDEVREKNSYFGNCNLSNSKLKIPSNIIISDIENVNFENCDLSDCIIDLTKIIDICEWDRKSRFNLKNTNATVIFDASNNKVNEIISFEVLEELKKDSFVGCYVNGEFILSPEEIAIKKQEKQELQRLKEEIASLFREQQEEDKPKHV